MTSFTCSRRRFLGASAAVLAGGAIGRPLAAGGWRQTPAFTPRFTSVRRNVGVYTGRGGTIGYLVSPDAVVIVDTQYPDSAGACLDGLTERTGGRRIDVVFNTHHHADHTGGNPVFEPAAQTIVAQSRVPDLQRQAAAQAVSPAAQVYADATFEGAWNRAMGDEVVHARTFTPAHTGGDAVVYFEKANVVHVGDLVFNRLQAYVDRPGGASAVNWIAMVEQVAAAYPADAIYVFGHAGTKFDVTGTRADVLLMRDYLTALVEYVKRAVAAGTPRDTVIASTAVLDGFPDYGPLSTRALTGTYDELAGR